MTVAALWLVYSCAMHMKGDNSLKSSLSLPLNFDFLYTDNADFKFD